MADEPLVIARPKAWFVARSGPLSGSRYLLPDGITRIGRNADNDIVIQGPDAAIVSLYHAEITKDGERCRLRDLNSTNGTYVNGERIGEAELTAQSVVQLGKSGQEFAFVTGEPDNSEMDRTLVIPEGLHVHEMRPAAPPPEGHEALLNDAVLGARRARAEGPGGQTMTLMRDALKQALRRHTRPHRTAIVLLAASLAGLSGYGYWRISRLKSEKAAIDGRIQTIESQLRTAVADPDQTDRLISELSSYQTQAASLQRSLLYRIGASAREPLVTREIRALMIEFGAEVYSIPPEFADRVNHYIQQYQGADRPLMDAALSQYRSRVEVMRRVLEDEKLPPDLAYIPLVESALSGKGTSAAGAAGPWQFTPPTARAYGLRVDGQVDQRNNLTASTRAACRYLRDLILDFGSGSSVMLALAAYNLGPPKVKQAIAKNVKDPIKQRNFWYLYRARALPGETREYVPKVFAAIIIGRNPEKFGF